MASVLEHNNLIKVVFNGSKHLNHVMSSEEIRKMTMIDARYPITRMPVCGHCERIGYWTKNGSAYCPSCGTYTKTPITYSSYLASGYDISGSPISHELKEQRKKQSIILPDY